MKACEELKSHLETQKADAKDIYYYLHKKLTITMTQLTLLKKNYSFKTERSAQMNCMKSRLRIAKEQ